MTALGPETTSPQLEAITRQQGLDAVEIFVPIGTRDTDLAIDRCNDIANPETSLRSMGFAFEQNERGISITVPSVDKLNTELISIGHNDRKYVEFNGDFAPINEYLELISKGQIPVATEPFEKMHDSGDHRGWMFLPKRAMGLLKKVAAEASANSSEAAMKQAVGDIDISTVGEITEFKLRQLYALHMGKLTAAILAHKDIRDVNRATKILNGNQTPVKPNKPVLSRAQEYDEELPIK